MDDALEGLAGFVSLRASLSDGGGAVQVWTELVTSNWFQVVRPEMEIGRPLQPGDEDAVVLSHAFWTRHFGGSRSVLGRTVVINGQPFTVVGVTDPLFSGTRLGAFAPEVWMPLRTIERVRPDLPRFLESRERQWLIMVGRLAEGVSKERAEASANIVATALGEAFPASHAERRVRVVSNERPENEAAHGISPRRLCFGGLVAMDVSDGFFEAGSMGALDVSNSDPNVVCAGTGSACTRGNISTGIGVYKSDDAAETWSFVGLPEAGQIGAVEVHPDDPDLVYVAALAQIFGKNDERGVYRSEDGGGTWERVLFASDSVGALDLSNEPAEPADHLRRALESRAQALDDDQRVRPGLRKRDLEDDRRRR